VPLVFCTVYILFRYAFSVDLGVGKIAEGCRLGKLGFFVIFNRDIGQLVSGIFSCFLELSTSHE
jgi:hypothetical protein